MWLRTGTPTYRRTSVQMPAFCVAILAAAQAAAGPVSPSERLHVRADRLFISATLNGAEVQALLDSGAEMSLIDDDLAERLGLDLQGEETVKGSGGEEAVRFATGVTIDAARTRLADRTVAVLDLEPLSRRLIGTDVPMILGRDLFDAGRFEVDVEGGKLRRLDRTAAPQGRKLPLTSSHGIEHLPASVEGHAPVQAELDLGNGSEVLIGKAYAEHLGLSAPERIVERKTGGGLGGPIERDIVVLSRLELAGVVLENVRAAIDPQPNAGDLNVGVSVLRRFVLVIDFPERAVWLRSR